MLSKVFVAIVVLSVFLARVVEAGCGCDHPPPLRGTVYPRFAWSGAPISVYEPDLAKAGAWAKVGGQEVKDYLPTTEPETRRMIIPKSVNVGPAKIEVFDRRGQRTAEMSSAELTVLPQPVALYEAEGVFTYEQVMAAVDADGTLLLPFDLTALRRPMQFYVTFEKLPLRFNEDQLVFYNKDQYNLKLFELLVEGPEDYQWGPYYGAHVHRSPNPGEASDVISYWRHEFESYYMAHRPGGTHAVTEDGLHPDGTPHIDHYNLVLGVSGFISDSSQPYDQSKWRRLQPSNVKADVVVRQLFANQPVPESALSTAQRAAIGRTQVIVTSDPDKGTIKLRNARTGKEWNPPSPPP